MSVYGAAAWGPVTAQTALAEAGMAAVFAVGEGRRAGRRRSRGHFWDATCPGSGGQQDQDSAEVCGALVLGTKSKGFDYQNLSRQANG